MKMTVSVAQLSSEPKMRVERNVRRQVTDARLGFGGACFPGCLQARAVDEHGEIHPWTVSRTMLEGKFAICVRSNLLSLGKSLFNSEPSKQLHLFVTLYRLVTVVQPSIASNDTWCQVTFGFSPEFWVLSDIQLSRNGPREVPAVIHFFFFFSLSTLRCRLMIALVLQSLRRPRLRFDRDLREINRKSIRLLSYARTRFSGGTAKLSEKIGGHCAIGQ